MKITEIRAVPVRIPLRRPFVTALGTLPASEAGIVIVDTDDGRHGLGEISLIWHGGGARLCRDVIDLVAPAVQGLDVFDLGQAVAAAAAALEFGRHSLTAVAALEMALLDLQGQAVGQPVMNLLGGPVHDRIPLARSLSIGPVTDMVAQARGHVAAGFRTIKVKGGRDVDHTAEVVEALRHEFGPELGIRVDPNMAYRTAKEALAAVRRLEPYGILDIEQPLPADDIDGMAFLRARCDVPVMADESVWSPTDAWNVITAGAADIINVYVSEAGGITAARRIADLCAHAGLGVMVGSMPELGIGASAAAHLAFTLPGLDHPANVAGGVGYHTADVVTHNLIITDGHLLAPTAPGLGVQLDQDSLQRHTAQIP